MARCDGKLVNKQTVTVDVGLVKATPSLQPTVQFLAKRDYTLRLAIAWQIRMSVVSSMVVCRLLVCDVRAPYSGGLTLRGYF